MKKLDVKVFATREGCNEEWNMVEPEEFEFSFGDEYITGNLYYGATLDQILSDEGVKGIYYFKVCLASNITRGAKNPEDRINEPFYEGDICRCGELLFVVGSVESGFELLTSSGYEAHVKGFVWEYVRSVFEVTDEDEEEQVKLRDLYLKKSL